ncbi:peptidylprolyl isomerase [Rhodanobacter glycinis]|uniref:peptidylprolyl isomerase n=1 Tax=Rhodanobacter glycinis TaxID=582702 RepID=A0A1I4FVY1_9GAMM|nr:peptidylprolyl isomerase [Rhodanobacter glycinis]SFL22052.1 peptidylprolyl isomerase [Rhodanobacter glycinis]
MRRHLVTAVAIALGLVATQAIAAQDKPTPTTKQLLAAAKPAEWRTPAPDNLLYMQLPQGRVVIELAPAFTPLHAANIRTLVRQHYFDGLAIVRVQDNFVTQWDDPNGDDGGDKAKMHPLGKAKATLLPEFTRSIDPKQPWTPLPDGDVYAPQVGFSGGFPVARDPANGEEWLVQCYGMVGVGRDVPPNSGNGSALYAIIGQAPRRLDHNLAVAGRVLQGMQYLSALPRGTGPMGFYAKASERTPIISVKLASELPPAQREKIQVLRTTSPTFTAMIDAARHGHNAFYPTPVGKLGICDIHAPVRVDGKPVSP